jgi:DNA-entry nuclease
MKYVKIKGKKVPLPVVIVFLILAILSWFFTRDEFRGVAYSESVQNIPEFSGRPYVVINNNQPEFTEDDYTTESYEYYAPLDKFDRCILAMACVGYDLMPTDERGSISSVKPSGWVQAQYDVVDGKNLYNRCHMIGFQLTGENANEKNLITGTRYMNVEGMLPFENMIADYVKETRNHVLYRVTPVYDGTNLVARGVQLEALSMEDNGDGICFNVYVYNNQPGVVIDYATGESRLAEAPEDPNEAPPAEGSYVLNTTSMKFHVDTCTQADGISEKNRDTFTGARQELLDQGYVPAGCCDP